MTDDKPPTGLHAPLELVNKKEYRQKQGRTGNKKIEGTDSSTMKETQMHSMTDQQVQDMKDQHAHTAAVGALALKEANALADRQAQELLAAQERSKEQTRLLTAVATTEDPKKRAELIARGLTVPTAPTTEKRRGLIRSITQSDTMELVVDTAVITTTVVATLSAISLVGLGVKWVIGTLTGSSVAEPMA